MDEEFIIPMPLNYCTLDSENSYQGATIKPYGHPNDDPDIFVKSENASASTNEKPNAQLNFDIRSHMLHSQSAYFLNISEMKVEPSRSESVGEDSAFLGNSSKSIHAPIGPPVPLPFVKESVVAVRSNHAGVATPLGPPPLLSKENVCPAALWLGRTLQTKVVSGQEKNGRLNPVASNNYQQVEKQPKDGSDAESAYQNNDEIRTLYSENGSSNPSAVDIQYSILENVIPKLIENYIFSNASQDFSEMSFPRSFGPSLIDNNFFKKDNLELDNSKNATRTKVLQISVDINLTETFIQSPDLATIGNDDISRTINLVSSSTSPNQHLSVFEVHLPDIHNTFLNPTTETDDNMLITLNQPSIETYSNLQPAFLSRCFKKPESEENLTQGEDSDKRDLTSASPPSSMLGKPELRSEDNQAHDSVSKIYMPVLLEKESSTHKELLNSTGRFHRSSYSQDAQEEVSSNVSPLIIEPTPGANSNDLTNRTLKENSQSSAAFLQVIQKATENPVQQHSQDPLTLPTKNGNGLIKFCQSAEKGEAPTEVETHLCHICGKGLSDRGCLRRHMLTHLDNLTRSCNFCHKTFPYRSSLEQHMSVHTGDKKFVCTFCPKKFSYKNKLVHHMRSHTNEQKLYSCYVCGKGFNDKFDMKQHVMVHTGTKPHACPLCDQRFTQKSQLMTHMRKHTGEKPYSCTLCSQTFRVKTALDSHMNTHFKSYSCHVCNKQFSIQRKLTVHLSSHSKEIIVKDMDSQHVCSVCKDSFDNRTKFLKHFYGSHLSEEGESNSESHLCPICKKSFLTRELILAHMDCHIDGRPHHCRFCQKAFAWPNDLKLHLRTHVTEKPCTCDICGENFPRVYLLTKHRRKHIDEQTQP